MSKTTHATLDIDREENFLDTERRVQRAGIGVMTLLVALGAAGLFGDGPLSHAQAQTHTLTVTYERFTRQTARQTLSVESQTSGDAARVAIDKAFLDHYAIEEVRPPQAEVEDLGSQLVFVVPASGGSARLNLHLEALGPGVFSTRIDTGGTAITVRQIVFF